MGRVYNALVKAGRFDERGRPIARPLGPRPVRRSATPGASTPPRPRVEKPAIPFTSDSLVVEGIKHEGPPQKYSGFGEPGFPDMAAFVDSLLDESRDAGPRVTAQAPQPEIGLSDLETEIRNMQSPAARSNVSEGLAILKTCEVVRMSARASSQLAALGGLDNLARERYYTLAARVLNLAARRKIKTILVTSAEQGEGKTTVAANLAAVIGRMPDRRVLLLDADARCPAIEKTLGLRLKRGWLDVIEGKARPEQCAVRVEASNLFVMGNPRVAAEHAADRIEGKKAQDDGIAAVELLSFSGTARLLGSLADSFDFVIIDAPPISVFGETQRLASMVDASILVVKAERTGREEVTSALKLIPKERRMGVVLNESQIEDETPYSGSKHRSFFDSLFGRSKRR